MRSKLYESYVVGSLELKNRIVMPAMNLGYCDEDGFVTDKLISFYKARSLGRAGLIVAGAAGIDPEYINRAGVIQISHDKYIDGLRRFTDGVHEGGAAVFIQLWHPGAYGKSSEHDGKQAVAPSEYLSNFTHEMTRELSIPEIKRLVSLFGEAALRAKSSGFDGVELIGSAGYLISQFLSPKTNLRTDEYGGDTLDKRMRFLREIVKGVKKHAGNDFPLMVRLSGNEFVSGGNSPDYSVLVASALERLGVHAISITGGWHETSVPQLTMDVPRGAFAYLANAVKLAVSIPVVACNRLDAATAEMIVDSEIADMAAIARGFVAEPDFGVKAAAGQYELIRPCIGCNQRCMDNIFRGKPLGCLANVDVASENTLGSRSDTVLVIGAGPAGMEYARVSASMGAKVTVWEKRSTYGGALNIAAVPSGRQDIKLLAEYLYSSCIDLGVKFVFNKAADEQMIKSALVGEFNHVVIASGGIEAEPEFKVNAPVSTIRQVLSGDAEIGAKAIIIGSGASAVETALYLKKEGTIGSKAYEFLSLYNAESPERLRKLTLTGGREVTIVSRKPKLGTDIGISTRWSMLQRLKWCGVNHVVVNKILEVGGGGVLVETDVGEKLLECDSVVLALGKKAVHSNWPTDRVTVIGDALKPAKADDAIHAAYRAAVNWPVD